MPPDLASCGPVHGETDIEQYLIEAHQQVAECKSLCALWVSGNSLTTDPSSRDQSCDEDVEEGMLLFALLNKLERLLDQVCVCVFVIGDVCRSIVRLVWLIFWRVGF